MAEAVAGVKGVGIDDAVAVAVAVAALCKGLGWTSSTLFLVSVVGDAVDCC